MEFALSLKEARAREALAAFLRSGSAARKAFFDALPEHIVRIGERSGVDLIVKMEWPTDAGGRIDLVLYSGRMALAIELKIDHRESSFQYCSYRAFLRRMGFETQILGIAKKLEYKRGRAAINAWILNEVADHRITWRTLLANLRRSGRAPKAVEVLNTAIWKIDPSVFAVEEKPPRWIPSREIGELLTNPSTFGCFFRDISAAVPEFGVEPHQLGNAPPTFRIGKQSWADWFGDHDPHRMQLMIDYPRERKPIPNEMHFHVCVTLWNKTFSGQTQPERMKRIATAAAFLSARGFDVRRNVPHKWANQTSWRPPYDTGGKGFLYSDAFDEAEFQLLASNAIHIGWGKAVEQIAGALRRIEAVIDRLTTMDCE